MFRKEIEQNHVQKVYEMITMNPRFLVSSGDTPSILKEGPRYNALHIAAMNKRAKMAKLILQTVEQPAFIEHLHGFKDDPMVYEMSQFLLESYLNTPDKSRNDTPLHFAAKLGAVDVIEVLISYPLCKKKPNSEGKYPEDVSWNCLALNQTSIVILYFRLFVIELLTLPPMSRRESKSSFAKDTSFLFYVPLTAPCNRRLASLSRQPTCRSLTAILCFQPSKSKPMSALWAQNKPKHSISDGKRPRVWCRRHRQQLQTSTPHSHLETP